VPTRLRGGPIVFRLSGRSSAAARRAGIQDYEYQVFWRYSADVAATSFDEGALVGTRLGRVALPGLNAGPGDSVVGYGQAKDHCFGWTVFDPGGYDVLAGGTHRGRVEVRLRPFDRQRGGGAALGRVYVNHPKISNVDIRLTSSKARAELARIGCASVRQIGANRF